MIPIPMSENYHKNLEKGGADEQHICLICGRGITNPNRAKWLNVIGGNFCAEPGETVPDNEDSGPRPVGPDCARKHPDLPYTED